MKAKNTIQKQIRRLEAIADDTDKMPLAFRLRCYDVYHALRWVIEDVNWTPAGLAETEAAEEAGGKQ